MTDNLPKVTGEMLERLGRHALSDRESQAIVAELRRLREFVQAVYDFRMDDGERLPFNTCDYYHMEDLGASSDKTYSKERKSALYMSERIDAEIKAQAVRDAANDLFPRDVAFLHWKLLMDRAEEIEGVNNQ